MKEEYIDTTSAGAILEYIPTFVKRHAMSEVVIKTPGPENQRGGVQFDITINGLALRWKVIHSWLDYFEVTYSKPDSYEEDIDMYEDNELPFTEEMDVRTFVGCFIDLQNHMLDSKLLWEEE